MYERQSDKMIVESNKMISILLKFWSSENSDFPNFIAYILINLPSDHKLELVNHAIM